MKKVILPILLMLIGIGGGVGAGLMLMGDPEEELAMDMENPCGDVGHTMTEEMAHEPDPEPIPLEDREYARMNNQFVVPVVKDDRVNALMVMSLSIEVAAGGQEAVFSHEPRLPGRVPSSDVRSRQHWWVQWRVHILCKHADFA